MRTCGKLLPYARIFGPDGAVIAGGLPPDVEGIATADLDLTAIEVANFFTDPVGHYARPDVFSLTVDRRRKRPINFEEAGSEDTLA